MHDIQPRPVKTGADPRQLTGFITLREEMAKLTHPARPDVNWQQVESLSLSLFELNGVELQTGVWYTLARSHLARINGLNEGLAILTALLSYQWAQLWPQPIHARAEILNGLFQRLQKLFRTFSLTHRDLPALMQTEALLQAMSDILMRQALQHACKTAPLMQQLQSALARLENSSSQHSEPLALTLPSQTLAATPPDENRLVYVIHPEPEVNVQTAEETAFRMSAKTYWVAFLAGACSALVAGTIVLWGWQSMHRMDSASQALMASVAALPQILTTEQVQTLRKTPGDKGIPSGWVNDASAQLKSLADLPPDWALQQGNALIKQAQVLWPDAPEIKVLQKQWQTQRTANVLTSETLTGWHEGMMQLQTLSDQLELLDRQPGKYLTGSELKSMVFRMMTSFRQTIPLEEQLRLLQMPQQEGQDFVTLQQVQRHLTVLLNTYGQQNTAPEIQQ